MNKPIHESKTRTVRGLKELLPERWKLIKLKLVCNIETGFAFPSEVFGETGTPVIRITDIKDREINLSEIKRVDDLLLKSKPKRPSVNKGDIIMAMTGATIGKVGYYNSDKPSYLNQRVCRFIPASIDRGYLWHTLNSEIYKKYIELEAFGGAQANISDSQLLNFPAPLPELEAEQQKIAQFLDYETAKIDALIDEQKRLIELLKEKRQAVISHAVTKGLNPDAPMKDSGVEWLGEVPEHWRVGRLKNHLRLKNGQDYKGVETVSADGFPVIGSGGQFTKATKFLHDGESVLLGRKGTIDKPIYINGKFWTVDTMFYSEVFKSSNAKYVYYLAMTIPFSLYSTNTALPSMSQSDLHNHITVIPPLVEQSEIANYIDEQLEKLDTLSDRLLTNSKLLQERRSALISAAVTGKIDVRDWQPPAGSDTVDSNALMQTERHYG